MKSILNFFRPAAHAEPLPAEKVDSAYKRYRVQIFLSIFLGYAGYYLIRKNFTLAVPYLLEEGFTKTQLGLVMSALALSYGVSKFVMGNFSDRSNPRYFLAAGLILSAIVSISFSFTATSSLGISVSVTLMFILMFLNGWFQGMGWPPCGRTLTHWFSDRERGTKVSLWNTAHNFGGGIIGPLATLGILIFVTWKSIFFFPALIAIVIAVLYLVFARDTPQSVGLPPIEEYKNDYPAAKVDDRERELSAREILVEHVLKNRYLWFIAIANIFVYLVRYGVIDWVPTYLTEVKGFSAESSRWAFFIFEYAAIPGTILVGWLSDKVFHGRRAPLAIICMLGVTVAALTYWLSSSLFVVSAAVAIIGFLIYGPVMLIGVSALDLAPKKAAGSAAGFTGLFGYVGGAVLANLAIGGVVDLVGWDGGFLIILGACVLSIVFLSLTWDVHDRSEDEDEGGKKGGKKRLWIFKPVVIATLVGLLISGGIAAVIITQGGLFADEVEDVEAGENLYRITWIETSATSSDSATLSDGTTESLTRDMDTMTVSRVVYCLTWDDTHPLADVSPAEISAMVTPPNTAPINANPSSDGDAGINIEVRVNNLPDTMEVRGDTMEDANATALELMSTVGIGTWNLDVSSSRGIPEALYGSVDLNVMTETFTYYFEVEQI